MMKSLCLFPGAVCAALFSTMVASDAAVTAISSITKSGANNQVQTLTGITVGGSTYTDLQGASSVVLEDTGAARFWVATDPVTPTAATTGLTVSNGALNVLGTFQFGRLLTANDMLFFMDLEADEISDSISVRLVDSTGAAVGSADLAISGSDFSGYLTQAGTYSRSNGGDLGSAYGILGVSFLTTDFAGDVSTATGFRISQTGGINIDPTIAGVAVIPEPGSVVLAVGALALGLARRRRR